MPGEQVIKNLKKYIKKEVTIEYYSVLQMHPPDDSPSLPQINKHKKTGILNEVTSNGIVVDSESIPFFEEDDMMKRGHGVPVGVGYITTGSGISQITWCKIITLYKNAHPYLKEQT